MNTLPTKRFVSLAAATSIALLYAAGAAAAPKDGVPLMNDRAVAKLAELPAIAKAQSGVIGALNSAALDASALELTLADGRRVTARLQRVARDDGQATKSWVGSFDEQPGSILVLTRARGVVTGFASYGPETWEIMPAKGGKAVLYQVDDAKLPKTEHVMREDAPDGSEIATDYGSDAVSTDATTGYVHDLLIVYTPAAKAAYGQATLESMIRNAVAAANQAYLNSKIGITLNLVGLQETTYSESGSMSTTLADLIGTSDGKLDAVHKLRDSVGADLVTLVSQDTSSCGISYVMRSESSGFSAKALNVVKTSCLSQHSLAHELGHAQGSEHDRGNASGSGAFGYSYGFRRCVSDGTGFRTVMSYSCSGASRVAWFSNPNAYYNGYATGVAYESDPANSADNARSMSNTADTVAAFRSASGGSTAPVAPTAPTAPSSLSASATAYNSVTVRWSDTSSNEAGFKVERSADGVTFVEVASLGSNVTSFVDGAVQAQRNYWYRARAFSSAGNSAYSNVGTVTTPSAPPPPPAAPTSIAATNNADGSAMVSWIDGSTNESSFELRREAWDAKRNVWKSATVVATVPSGQTSLVDLSGAGTFRYSVRAMNAGGASGYAGPASTTVTGGSKGRSGRNK